MRTFAPKQKKNALTGNERLSEQHHGFEGLRAVKKTLACNAEWATEKQQLTPNATALACRFRDSYEIFECLFTEKTKSSAICTMAMRPLEAFVRRSREAPLYTKQQAGGLEAV